MHKNKKFVLFLAVTYTTVLFYFTFGNANNVIPDTGFEFQDKVFHFLAYLGLSFLWCYYFILISLKKALIVGFISTLCVGIVLEILQEIINPLRTYDTADLIANCLGVIFGTIIVTFCFQRMKLKY